MPWFSETVDAALVQIGTGMATLAGAIFYLRRRFSSDTTEITKDKAEAKWIISVIEERSHALKAADEAKEARIVDARTIAKLEAQLEAAWEKLREFEHQREKTFGACEERVRSLAEQVLDLKMANGRMLKELAAVNKEAAERVLVMQVRPGPAGPGDEPP
jgi:chromosome segregation ATPase